MQILCNTTYILFKIAHIDHKTFISVMENRISVTCKEVMNSEIQNETMWEIKNVMPLREVSNIYFILDSDEVFIIY